MKRSHRWMAAAAAAGFVFAAAQPAEAGTTLTMSSWLPPSHELTKYFLLGWAKKAEEVTGGDVKFQMLPKAPVHAPGTLDGVHDDLMDMSFTTTSYTPGRFVLSGMAELPGGGPTATINSLAYSKIYWSEFRKAHEWKGVHVLGVFTHGPGQLFNDKRPVTKAADLKGLKIRTGGGVAAEMGKALGMTLLFKPAPAAYQLLKEGVADGVTFPLEAIHSFHLQHLIRYATLFHGGFYYSAFGFIMNEDKWNALPQRDKDALNKISRAYVAQLAGHVWDRFDKIGLADLKHAGAHITYASPAFEREVDEVSKPIVADWIKKANAKGVDGAKALADFHAEVRRLEKMKK